MNIQRLNKKLFFHRLFQCKCKRTKYYQWPKWHFKTSRANMYIIGILENDLTCRFSVTSNYSNMDLCIMYVVNVVNLAVDNNVSLSFMVTNGHRHYNSPSAHLYCQTKCCILEPRPKVSHISSRKPWAALNIFREWCYTK